MHIENIHCILEKVSECTKSYADSGIDNINTEEFGQAVDMIKDLAEAEYYSRVSVAMDEAKDKEKERKFFHDPARTTLDIYGEWPYDEDMYVGKAYYPMRSGRNMNKSYYPTSSNSNNSGRSYYSVEPMDEPTGEFEKHMRKYMSAKVAHSDNTADNKQWRTQEVSKALDGFKSDIMDMISNSTADEKAIYKQKITALANSL